MILHNILSGLTLLALLTTSFLGAFVWQLPLAAAQTDSFMSRSCPIDGDIEANFGGTSDSIQVEDTLSRTIQIANNSSFSFSGIRVAVAVYQAAADTVPAYWSVLPEEYQLSSEEIKEASVDLDLSALPAGEYILKTFAMQGDETAILGEVLLGTELANEIILKKTTAQKNGPDISVAINGETFGGQAVNVAAGKSLEVLVEVKNENETPLLGNQILGVITEGAVPLGTAVQVDTLDSTMLVPGQSLTKEFYEPHVVGGEYTVYAALVNGQILQPIVAVPVRVPDREGNNRWSYVSKVGLSNYPLQADTEVIACIRNFGIDQGINRFLEPLGAELVVSAESGDLATERMTSAEANTRDYFSFTPQVEAYEFSLVVDLLQEKYVAAPSTAAGEETESSVHEGFPDRPAPSDNLVSVDIISQSFTCPENETCTLAVSASGGDYGDNNQTSTQKSPWFYASIVIAAALLMYLMLRRLDSEDIGSPQETSDNELQ